MKLIILLLLITSCDRDCDVTCYAKDNCTVKYSTFATNSYLSMMKPEDANSFCTEFNGVQKFVKKK